MQVTKTGGNGNFPLEKVGRERERHDKSLYPRWKQLS